MSRKNPHLEYALAWLNAGSTILIRVSVSAIIESWIRAHGGPFNSISGGLTGRLYFLSFLTIRADESSGGTLDLQVAPGSCSD